MMSFFRGVWLGLRQAFCLHEETEYHYYAGDGTHRERRRCVRCGLWQWRGKRSGFWFREFETPPFESEI